VHPICRQRQDTRTLATLPSKRLPSPRGKTTRKRSLPEQLRTNCGGHGILFAARKSLQKRVRPVPRSAEIARAAGVGKKTLYNYVGDKAELFTAAYEAGTSEARPPHFECQKPTPRNSKR